MIRVYFEDREPHDVPANWCQVGTAGELILQVMEAVEETDPKDIRRKTIRLQVKQWIRTYGPASRWLYAEPISEDGSSSSSDSERELQEVFP